MDINSLNIELASELAHLRVVEESKNNNLFEDDLFKDSDATVLEYKDDIQDIFNSWYDYYLNEIEKIYSQPLKTKKFNMAKKLNKQEIDAILRKVNSIIIEKVIKYNDSIFKTIPSQLTEDILKNVDAKYDEYQAILEQKKELDSKLTDIYNDLKKQANTLFPNTYVPHNNNSFTRETLLQYEKQYKRNYCLSNNIKLATIPSYTDILDEIIINSSGEVSEIIDITIKKFSPDEKNN